MNGRQIAFYMRLATHSLGRVDSLYVLSYPRSGSSWLSRMLSSVMGLPYGKSSRFIEPQIIHLHRFAFAGLNRNRTVYIVRDVRDCFLSYAHALSSHLTNGQISEKRLLEQLGVTRAELDPADARFCAFTRKLMTVKKASINWVDHVRLAQKYHFVKIRYEDLYADAASVLEGVISQLRGSVVSSVSNVVEEHLIEKERQKGLPVRTGGTEKWRTYVDCTWVDEVSQWAKRELRDLDYEA